MTSEKIDFGAEGLTAKPVEAPAAEDKQPSEADLMEYINGILMGLQDSMGSMQIGLRVLNQRITGMEKFVSYLLEKDPVLGPKLKAQADREDAAAKAKADGTQG